MRITPEQLVSNLDPARVMQSVFYFTIYRVSEPENGGEQLSSIWTFELVNKDVLLSELQPGFMAG